jgi:phosphoribosylaminoimidazole carboxylase PurE protein
MAFIAGYKTHLDRRALRAVLRDEPARGSEGRLAAELREWGFYPRSQKGEEIMAATVVEVGIVLGSDSDWGQVEPATALLKEWGVPFEVMVASAHRAPQVVQAYARDAAPRGLKVIIAAAGAAAHLAGVLAAETVLPVIGVPMPSPHLMGLDSLLSTVQMPAGVPVATMAIGSAGSKNAAIFAVQILALNDPRLQERLKRHKQELEQKVAQQGEKIPLEFRGGK